MNAEVKKLGPLAEICRFDNNCESTVYGYLRGCFDCENSKIASEEIDNYAYESSHKLYVPDSKQELWFIVAGEYVVIREWDDSIYDSFVICRQITEEDIEYIVHKVEDLDEILYKTFFVEGETPTQWLMRALEGAESRKYDHVFYPLRTRLEAINF